MIDKATVQRIKDTANIVEVVSDYVHLTRRGSNYMGLCPFHNERTPSFSVNPRRNICHCFSCGKGGSPVNFIMEKESISYHDALKQLAKKYGIKVEERELTPEERQRATEREGLLIAAEAAMKQMEADLLSTDEGRSVGLSYLYGRQVTDEAIKAFHLGYALDKGNHMTGLLQRQGFDLQTLKSLGITGVSQAGNNYDKYRGRVIFPIMNSSGKVVGFGGRDLKGGPAKYINSPESVLYRKNNELYGIFQAKNEIVRQNRCFLVEGYLDVISMWQSGLKNVVASSGTALTDGQIAMIHRFTPNITLVYDGDAAGIKAALRGIDMLLSHKLKVSVLLLPDGHDPDSFARENTPESFREYVERHSCDIIRFKIDVLMKDAGDDPQKKAAVVSSVVESIACIPEGVDRTVYVGECARLMKLDEAAVQAAVERARFRILEQQSRDRQRREAQRRYPDGDPTPTQAQLNTTPGTVAQNSQSTPAPEATKGANPGIDSSGVASPAQASANTGPMQSADPLIRQISNSGASGGNPMRPLEARMMELLVKYGFLDWNLCSGNSETEEAIDARDYYTVLDFVGDELDVDKVEFSEPVFKKVYTVLNDLLDDFFGDFIKYRDSLEEKLALKRREGHEEIARKVATMADIEREELRLERKLEDERKELLKEFARFYPGDRLASHEDADVRRVTTRAINEKYILSNIFVKNGSPSSEDEVGMVNRALVEWKSEILNQMVIGDMAELRRVSSALDNDDFHGLLDSEGQPLTASSAIVRMQELQGKIASMMMMRSKVAKNLGDRILCARTR